MENLVRSAIAPETIVAEVAQNTVWNTRKPSVGSEVADEWLFYLAKANERLPFATDYGAYQGHHSSQSSIEF